ncbi:hypothetical protein AB0D99_33260 [Streptomyces sp. NPDC047971]|uniref:hypothetical protein n=1 Tax=Streptomyces sp. NPDC047971 TaxID=3154499 RepID=UPI0033C52B73
MRRLPPALTCGLAAMTLAFGPAPGPWVTEEFPAGTARLLDAERIDADTTWTAGFRSSDEGKQRLFRPVLFSREDSSHRWKRIPTPLDDTRTRINAIGASPEGDAWLVGDADEGTRTIHTAHRDDTGWKLAPAPLPESALSGGFLGVDAVDRDDAWAVGWTQPEGPLFTFHGLIERWDGVAWRQVAPPALGTDYWSLWDITAIAPDDVWAAGAIGTPEGLRPLLLHYDGTSWSRRSAPELDSLAAEFTALASNGPSDVWAVGRVERGADGRDHGLVAHFDGTRWSVVDAPVGQGRLYGVTVARDAVAVVGDQNGTKPIGARLRHGRWQALRLPVVGTQGTAAADVVTTGRALTVVGVATDAPAAGEGDSETRPFAIRGF